MTFIYTCSVEKLLSNRRRVFGISRCMLSTLSSLKVIASEYPQLCHGSVAHKLGGDVFLQKIKLTLYEAVFSLVSYGNQAALQSDTVCVSSDCNF